MVSRTSAVATARGAGDTLLAQVARALSSELEPGAHLCVGLSGGVDSVVLLDVLTLLAPCYRWRLSAIHVNHQLNPRAAEWARFCRRLCRARGVPLKVVKVNVTRGDSIEAAAREARYTAYRTQPAPHVVLAQHLDDQAETVLLQLLRGAGVRGLAAMPLVRADRRRSDLKVLRPLLGVTRRELERYARARDLQWVEDDSNGDVSFLRNFLRREILPRVETRVPAYRATLARAATQLAEAAQLLDALAAVDGADALAARTLPVSLLKGLPAPRARNLLRYFLAAEGVRMPDARRLQEASRQLLAAKADAQVRVNIGDALSLRRYRGLVHVVRSPPEAPQNFSTPWRGERRLALPELRGVLTMQRGRGVGIDLEKLLQQPVTLRCRRGGEKFKPDAARPRRAVKALLQAANVPPWQRDGVPFLWSGERLVWVAGLGIDCAFQAAASTPGVQPRWIAQAAGDQRQ